MPIMQGEYSLVDHNSVAVNNFVLFVCQGECSSVDSNSVSAILFYLHTKVKAVQ